MRKSYRTACNRRRSTCNPTVKFHLTHQNLSLDAIHRDTDRRERLTVRRDARLTLTTYLSSKTV